MTASAPFRLPAGAAELAAQQAEAIARLSTTTIGWCHHTFNPWWGCSRVSAGCANCYAETWDARWGGSAWGAHGTRKITGRDAWRQPRKWARQAQEFYAETGQHPRVFMASMGDVFEDHPDLVEPRRRALELVAELDQLRWLIPTKRPENATGMAAGVFGDRWPDHVWIGTSIESARPEVLARIDAVLAVPARVRFLSCEPLLDAVDLTPWLPTPVVGPCTRTAGGKPMQPGDRAVVAEFGHYLRRSKRGPAAVDWVITGGESGRKARPADADWFRSLRDQCAAAGVPFWFKQWGEHAPVNQMPADTRAIWPHARPDMVLRAGKARTGRLLDGVEHSGLPMEATT